jgi:ADP-heptose:LPS heptosyltransferase
VADYASILVVRLSSLGDVLFALPAVQALLASGKAERVSWLVEDRAEALVRNLPGLHEVVVFPRRNRARWPAHAAALRARRDDVVLDLQGNLKSRLQLMLMQAPRKIGFDAPLAKEGAQRALTERFLPPANVKHRIAANLTILSQLGINVPLPATRPTVMLGHRPSGTRAAGARPRIVLHPGTSAFGQLKRWAPENFSSLGDRLVQSMDAEVFVSGGPREHELVHTVIAGMKSPARVLESAGLDDLADALRATDLLVAADSLPLHLANALGTPVLGLYGPKAPAVTGPYFNHSAVVRSGVACSPCTLRRCSDRICMTRLTVDAVVTAAAELIENEQTATTGGGTPDTLLEPPPPAPFGSPES